MGPYWTLLLCILLNARITSVRTELNPDYKYGTEACASYQLRIRSVQTTLDLSPAPIGVERS